TDIRLQFNKSHQPELVLVLSLSPQQAQEGVQELKEVLARGKHLQVEIKQHRKRRSLDANANCWVLCQKIAEVIGSTKEYENQNYIRDVCLYDINPIMDKIIDRIN